ncbi:MAG: 30S ribosomal protein S18 [candidate division Zixibacteria bacterium]|nr:30S ribosomal protein S18 [candidate division Zixibacteria bacterium]
MRIQRTDSRRLKLSYTGQRRKICRFCENKADYIDYKEDRLLRRFVNDRGKIIPRRVSGNCAKHQRQLTKAIKRARQLGMIAYTPEVFD